MKQKLPVMFASISFVILAALIVAGFVSPRAGTERSARLFARAASGHTPGTVKDSSGSSAPGSDEDTSPSVSEAAAEQHEAEDDMSSKSDMADDSTVIAAAANAKGAEDTEDAGAGDKEDIDSNAGREPLAKYEDILEVNPYLAGWLSIDGTKIDDPVVYTPKSQNYFLHRSIEGNDEERGTLFIAVNWYEGSGNTLIYGHNMKSGSGFGSLLKYADASYGMSHSTIHFDTLYEDREYELMAVFYSQIDEEELETEDDRAEADKRIEEESLEGKEEGTAPEELTLKDLDLYMDLGDADIYREEKDNDNGRFRYYYYTDLSDKADFDYFVSNVKERALYDTGVDAEWGDELLTFSTCSYQVKNGRFVVVSRRVR